MIISEWSNCCEATVQDCWLCSECKEHCTNITAEKIVVIVLNHTKEKIFKVTMIVEYEDGDIDYEIEQTLDELRDNEDTYDYMVMTDKTIKEDLDLT